MGGKCRTRVACKNAGQYCAAYIAGTGVHGNKHEVEKVIDKNLPVWAKDGADFFKKADELERANGRSYRGLVIAIPSEAKDKVAWVQSFVDDLLKDKHAYRLAYHFDPTKNNPHAHLMFCERGRMFEDKADDPKAYFTRKNGKDANLKRFDWLTDAKALYLEHIRKVAPGYTPAMTGEVKIGPEHKNGSKEYKEQRQLAIEANTLIRRFGADESIRAGGILLDKIDAEIAKIQGTPEGRARVMPTPSPSFVEKTPQKPAKQVSLVKQKIRTKIETDSVRLAEQISEDAQHAIQIGVNAMAIELETARREGERLRKLQTTYTIGEIATRIQPPPVPTIKPPAKPRPPGFR